MMTAEERGADSIRSDRLDGKEEVEEEGIRRTETEERVSERASEQPGNDRTTQEGKNDEI